MSKLSPFPRPASEEALSASLNLSHRLRRNRKAEWARRLVRENVLTANDLIWPVFIVEGASGRTPVASMPGVERLTIGEAVREAERAAALDIPAMARVHGTLNAFGFSLAGLLGWLARDSA